MENALRAQGVHIFETSAGAVAAVDELVVLQSAFQPVFRCRRDRMEPVAFEALARPFRGASPLPPERYFDDLERERLGAIEQVVRHIHVRNAAHLPRGARRLFLNFHPSAFESPARIEQDLRLLGADLRAIGISPADLVCEITEQQEHAEEALKDVVYLLRARGYRIAVDDFGAGFADPGRVARLTPDIVKVDGALVRRHLATPEGCVELGRLVEAFGRDGIQCVLEGLETLEQVERARRTGAHFLQGFALAPPQLAPGEFASLIAAGRRHPELRLVKSFR
ncbi:MULTISPECIES: EAL domain-containing protein [unclassified Roseitalea]|uniref:EAL domain-containing protein n=1 Tax=unclassified Roseitalea TaxID=2639107 RepID=UPI00273ECC97|nr:MULTISPECIES: EAL domain-containing protein [unclassified Roseitalea]